MALKSSKLTGVSPRGEITFPFGQTDWVVPDGVTSISAVAVGAGRQGLNGGGGGGALSYVNDLAVTPGETLIVEVMNGSQDCLIRRGAVNLLLAKGATGTAGGDAASGVGDVTRSGADGTGGSDGGGGAAGYSADGNSGTGGAAASGIANESGGGVGLFGEGASASAGTGGGGSGGQSGYPAAGAGGAYGGGGRYLDSSANARQQGGPGAVRVVWPGATRQFPNTDVGPS
ncbi:MAG: hypothetical protein KI792_12675 [Alphaproteobacteria bacterium]|nr:hypothetical protein [Alphaproteobacteria bacterium SS10]